MKPPAELLEFLYRYDGPVQTLVLGLRQVVHEEMAPCHEYIFAMRSKVVLLYGATARVIADGICNISVFARHVTLGFSRGAELKILPESCKEPAGDASYHREKTVRVGPSGDTRVPSPGEETCRPQTTESSHDCGSAHESQASYRRDLLF